MKLLHWIVLALLLVACESDKTKRDRFFMLGNMALEDADHRSAIRLFTLSLQLDPDYKEAYNNRGVSYYRDGKPQEAIQDYNQALLLDDQYYECLHNRAQAYEITGRYNQSLKDYDRLIQRFPDSIFTYFGKGLVLTRMKAYADAYKQFDRVLELDHDNLEAITNQATLNFYMRNYKDAIRQIREVLQEQEIPDAYNTLNQIYLANGSYPEALDAIEKALDQNPTQPYFLNNRGFTYLMLDSLEKGLEDINGSILLDSENMWAMRNKGIYFLRKGDVVRAIDYFEKVVSSGAEVEDMYSYLGQSYFESGSVDKACESWRIGSTQGEVTSREMMAKACN